MELDLSNLGTVEVVFIALMGLVVMFFGYRVKKVAFFLIWFVLGFYLMSMLLPNISHVLPEEILKWPMYQSLIPIAGGLLLALLGFSIEKFCVGGICFALVMLITAQYFGTDIQTLAIGGIIGIVAAGAAIMVMKPATIVATAVAGAYTLTMALLVLIPNVNAQVAYFPTLITFSIIGGAAQFLTTKRIK